MTSQTLSELLILFMLLISCSRIFFKRSAKTDALASLPIIAFLLSVINFWAWGINVQEILISMLSFFVMLWNMRALFRLSAKLVVDHYGPWFIFISSLNLVLILSVLVLIVAFKPVNFSKQKMPVTVNTIKYHGNFKEGFEEINQPFQKTSGKVWIFKEKEVPEKNKDTYKEWKEKRQKEESEKEKTLSENQDDTLSAFSSDSQEKENTEESSNTLDQEKIQQIAEETIDQAKKFSGIILFIPSKATRLEYYNPTLVKLAHDGFTVYAAQFNSEELSFFNSYKDSLPLRSRTFRHLKKENPEKYAEFIKSFKSQFTSEWSALISIVSPQSQENVYLISDEDLSQSMMLAKDLYPAIIDGIYDFSEISDYPTKGYGPVENTYPLLAKRLGVKKDSSLYMSSHLANEFEKWAEKKSAENKTIYLNDLE